MRASGDDANDDDDDDAAAVTRLLQQAGEADGAAGDRVNAALLPLVYDQLRRLAARHLRAERADHTLQATALVHEAYLRVAGGADGGRQWNGRWHFFAAAAEAMRRILVENARRRSRLKRGGDRARVSLDDVDVTVHEPPDDLLALDEALEALATQHPQRARLVKLRYFAGLTMDEAAAALHVSKATAERHWAYARAWLYRRMSDGPPSEGCSSTR